MQTRKHTMIHILKASEKTRIIQADKNDQWVDIQIQEMTINFQFISGNWWHGDMIMLYDPETGLFGWRFYFSPFFSGSEKIEVQHPCGRIESFLIGLYPYLLPNKIVYFKFNPNCPFVTEYMEFSEHYATLEEGRDQLFCTLERENKLGGIEYGRPNNYLFPKEIRLGLNEHVNQSFKTIRKNREFVRRKLNLAKVAYHDSQWKLTIESSEGEQTFIILDDNFNILKVSGYAAQDA
jgi:hypothetical protein